MLITELSVSTWLSRFFKLHNESSSLNSAHMHLHTSTSPFKEFPLKSHKDLINIITDASRANLSLSIMEFLLIPTMPTCGILIFFHLFLVVIIGWRKHQVILAPQQRKYAFPHRNPLDRGPPALDSDPTLWTDKHLWKHYLRKLRLRVVKMQRFCFYSHQGKETSADHVGDNE